MAKFDPLQYNYELVPSSEDVFHFQKIISKQKCVFTDIIELAYWSKYNCWTIFIETTNLKQFLPQVLAVENNKIYLFVGEIKNDFDFQFQMKRISMDPNLLIRLPS